MTEGQVWADFERLLSEDVLIDPGPEWASETELRERFPKLGRAFVAAWVKEQVEAGKLETRRGPDRRTGKVMSLYRIVR